MHFDNLEEKEPFVARWTVTLDGTSEGSEDGDGGEEAQARGPVAGTTLRRR